jgi:hypothetical protein
LGFAVALLASDCRGGGPAPRVHDEFSYLLAADTYAHGRLANPTPPLWEHFETFHVLQVPTYASKYPPGQGMVIALGQVLTGRPIVGVCLSYAIMCAALTWMLFAWVPPRWALWGGVFACLWLVGYQANLFSERAYWATSYWGGAVAACGGALLFGGVRRILVRPRVLSSVLTAVGLGILANSRPAEGLYAAIVPCAVLVAWLASSWRASLRLRICSAGLPVAAVLLAVGLLMAYYNYRVTGTPWKLPHMAYQELYGRRPMFVFQPPQPVHQYRNEIIHDFFVNTETVRVTSIRAWLANCHRGFASLSAFYVPFYLIPVLLLLPWAIHDRWSLLALGSAVLVVLGLAGQTDQLPHYAAPAVGPLLILYTLSARRLWVLHTGRARTGVGMVRIVFVCAATSVLLSAATSLATRQTHLKDWSERRQALIEELATRGGRHLVLVKYGLKHSPHNEWVYNGADIDGSPVVFARSLGPDADEQLRACFASRKAWDLEVDNDDGPFNLRPLSN